MLGASVQIAPVVLELEGVSKADWLLGARKDNIASTAASDLQAYARSIGVPSATAPITPLVYWCLRSYAAALDQVQPASRFFEKIRGGG